MRHQAEALEHHAHLVAADVDQLFVRFLQQILTIEQNLPRRRLDQPRQAPHDGRFTRAGQPHDDENFADMDIETDIGIGHDVIAIADRVRMGGGIGDTPIRALKELPRLSAVDLPDVPA